MVQGCAGEDLATLDLGGRSPELEGLQEGRRRPVINSQVRGHARGRGHGLGNAEDFVKIRGDEATVDASRCSFVSGAEGDAADDDDFSVSLCLGRDLHRDGDRIDGTDDGAAIDELHPEAAHEFVGFFAQGLGVFGEGEFLCRHLRVADVKAAHAVVGVDHDYFLETVIMTGAWSLGFSPLRALRSITLEVVRLATDALVSTRSMRMP